MEKYERLWRQRKGAFAEKIKSAQDAQSSSRYARELAEMELEEYGCENASCVKTEDSREKMFVELAMATEPVVRFLREKFDPHTTVMITDGFVKVVTDEIGMPMKEGNEE